MESYDPRSVNWSHPMKNSTHLPPKSPHGAYSTFSLFENPSVSGLNLPSHHHHHHRRSPSAGYIPQAAAGQSAAGWLADRLGSPDVVLKKCSHRRSSSDSVAFVDNSYQYMNCLENVSEEEEVEVPGGMAGMLEMPAIATAAAYRPVHRRGMSADHGSGDQSLQYKFPATYRSYLDKISRGDHNFNREHLPRLLESELLARPHLPINKLVSSPPSTSSPELFSLKAKKQHANARSDNSVSGASRGGKLRSSSSSGSGGVGGAGVGTSYSSSSCSGGGGTSIAATSFEYRSTASESNSHSDDSTDDLVARSGDRGGEEGAGTSSEQVDPKKAKRILANRQSAQRSRVRKLQYISELEMNVNLLETEVASLSPKVGYYDHERVLLSEENALLKRKLVALANTQQLKEAYNETLKTELHRLRSIFQQQQHYSQLQPGHPTDALELQLLRFSKLNLGSPTKPKPKSPTAAHRRTSSSSSPSSSASGRPLLYPTTHSPTRSPRHNNSSNNSPNRASPQRAPPSCMDPGGSAGFNNNSSSKPLGGGMMGGPTSFMVHNS